MSPGTFLPAVHSCKRFPAPGSVQQIPPAVLQRLTPPPASAPAPAGHSSALAPALCPPVCTGSAALAKSPGLCSCQALPRLSPARTRLYPPEHRCAGTGCWEGLLVFFSPWRVVVGPRRSGEPTFQGRLLLFAPHVGACREPGRGAAARRLCLGSRSRPLLRSRITPLPGRAARRQEGGGEGGEAGRRSG